MHFISKKQLVAICLSLVLILTGIGARYRNQISNFLINSDANQVVVTEVIDGDTIAVKFDGKVEHVRLIGVDTPELHHPKKPVQCYGTEAKLFTTKEINNQPVKLVPDPEDDNRDLYGRLLRYVYLANGHLLNADLVSGGYGFAYTYFPFVKKQTIIGLETVAKQSHLGLWAHCQVQLEGDQEQTNPV